MRRRGHHVGVRNRAGIDPRRYQARHVGHINQQEGTDLIGDLAEFGPVEDSAVGRETAYDELGFVRDGQLAQGIIVDQARVPIDPVLHRLINLTREIDRGAVGQMPTIGEAHA